MDKVSEHSASYWDDVIEVLEEKVGVGVAANAEPSTSRSDATPQTMRQHWPSTSQSAQNQQPTYSGYLERRAPEAWESLETAQTSYRHICTEPGCVGAYGSEPDMLAHMRFHLTHFGHSCRDCKMRFLSRRGIQEHYMRHKMVESHNCDICNSVLYNLSCLVRHMEFHIVEGFNKMEHAGYLYQLFKYQLDQQQALPRLSVQERSMSVATEFTNPTDTGIINTSSSNQYQVHRDDSQQFQPQQFSPGLSLQLQYIPAETGVTRSMNDTIYCDNSSSLPHAHQHYNQLYQPQQSLSGPSTQRATEAARTHSFRPLETTEYNTNYSSQYHESRTFTQIHQQQQLCLPEPTEIQPIRPIARRPCDIATSNTNYGHLHQAQAHGFMIQQPSLPRPSVPGPIVPAVTSGTTNTADSGRHSSGTDSGLTLLSLLALPAVHRIQTSTVPPARPEQQQMHVARSRKNKKFSFDQCKKPDCGNLYSRRIELESHRNWHNNVGKHVCERCELRFKQLGRYLSHMKIHAGDEPYECGECEMIFSQPEHLKVHKKIHSREEPRLPRPSIPGPTVSEETADTTNEVDISRYSSGEDSRLAGPSRIALPAARPTQQSPLPPEPMLLTSPEQQEFHGSPKPQPMESMMAPSLLPTSTTTESGHPMAAITPHTAEHASDPSLYISTFGTPSGIVSSSTASCTQHQQQIRNVSPRRKPRKHVHKCHHPECGRTFSRKCLLTEHLLWHQQSESLLCKWPGCGKRYTRISTLKTHVAIHRGEKPFSCEVCKKSFTKKYNLKMHSRIHRGKKE